MKQETTHQNRKSRNKDKVLILVVLIVLSLISATTLVYAYFSDSHSASLGATAGRLRLTADYSTLVNGVDVGSTTIENLNPGDAIVIKADVSNIGNKSAWTRESLAFASVDAEIIPFLEIYSGNYTRAQIKAGGLDDNKLTLSLGVATSPVRVIDGSGDAAELENPANYPSFNIIEDSSYESYYTIYFSHLATNEAQGKAFSLIITTQALQFRNNDEAVPNETAWEQVVAVQ